MSHPNSSWSDKTLVELAHIDILPRGQLRGLSGPDHNWPGIYFLWWKDDLVYIGKSTQLAERYRRLVSDQRSWHLQQNQRGMRFDTMTCALVPKEPLETLRMRLQDLERKYIATYLPPLNDHGMNPGT
jgi:hypothetical protein